MCYFELFLCGLKYEGCTQTSPTFFRLPCGYNKEEALHRAIKCPNSVPHLPCIRDDILYTCWSCRTKVYEIAWLEVNEWYTQDGPKIAGMRETKIEKVKRENVAAYFEVEKEAKQWAARIAREDEHHHYDFDKDKTNPVKWLMEKPAQTEKDKPTQTEPSGHNEVV